MNEGDSFASALLLVLSPSLQAAFCRENQNTLKLYFRIIFPKISIYSSFEARPRRPRRHRPPTLNLGAGLENNNKIKIYWGIEFPKRFSPFAIK